MCYLRVIHVQDAQELTKYRQTKKRKLLEHLPVHFLYCAGTCHWDEIAWHLTWHWLHGIVSKSKLSGVTVRDGSVTTEHSRTCTVGPCRTCRQKNNCHVCMCWVLLFQIGKHRRILLKCSHNYLYWHDNAYVSHLHAGSLGVKFNGEGLSFTTRQVFHSLKFHSKTWNNALKGYSVLVYRGKTYLKPDQMSEILKLSMIKDTFFKQWTNN